MTRFKSFGAALILSAALATPAFAQAAIQEPGNFAFFHPDGDLLHAGAAPDAMAMVPLGSGNMVRHHIMRHAAARRADRHVQR